MTLHWTLAEVVAAVGGSSSGDPGTAITSVGIDSRQITTGELFVAVAGDRFDGHDFVTDALDQGAAAAVVSASERSGWSNIVRVADTQAALRDLAAARRRELEVPVAAVTGSTGKTSTKDLLGAALPVSWASPRSYNNEFGVPLTVLATPDSARYLVVEVGSRGPGHIAWLMPAVLPDVAIITNLGVVHLETFGTVEQLTAAKWELVEALGAGGTAVVPIDDSRLHRSHRGRTVTFGESSRADVFVTGITLDDQGRPSFTLTCDVGERRVGLQMAGRHQAVNAAAAVAAGRALGVELDTLVIGLESAQGSPWRMEVHEGPITVVNDSYNANPDSVVAALETVAELPGRHVAVLGRMAELGPVAEQEHLRVGGLVERLGYAAVIVVGDDPGIARGAGRIARPVETFEEAESVLRGFLREGDVVLVKASRAVGLESLAQRLIEVNVA
jgi:UDP-N-acetylmuramoyl-tripeptide--D-alanyl-D-alanine ligase